LPVLQFLLKNFLPWQLVNVILMACNFPVNKKARAAFFGKWCSLFCFKPITYSLGETLKKLLEKFSAKEWRHGLATSMPDAVMHNHFLKKWDYLTRRTV